MGRVTPRDWASPDWRRGEVAMKVLRRFALAAGSLLALVLAGGAHARW
jgi:hypothetical protein